MKEKTIKNKLSNIFIGVCLVACTILFVFKVGFVKVVVNGSSMNPTIDNGSKGVMIKVNKNTNIKRFDVVAGLYGNSKDSYIIKRVLGLPNETVDLVDNKLYVNGEEVAQEFSFIPRTVNFPQTHWTLNEDEYLLVGDNRAATISPVVDHISKIIGKNGIAYLTYDINSSSCENYNDYAGCEIDNRKWYYFKNGK